MASSDHSDLLYLLSLWADGTEAGDCTAIQNREGSEPCGDCYICKTREAADEWYRLDEERHAA